MKLPLKLAIGLSFLLVVYAALRAWYVPVVYDEVFTFINYVVSGGFQPYYALLDANNHVVNSALTHVSFLMFGEHQFALRLPNLLALIIFLFYLIRMREMFADKWLWLTFFVSVTMIHYLFDFFSVSRGYGLSFAFLTAAIYYAWKCGQTRQLIHYGLALLMLSIALWSNMALMVTIVAMGGVLSLYLLVKGDKSLRYRAMGVGLVIVLFVAPVLYAALFSMELKAHGMLYLGKGFSAWDAIGEGLVQTMLGLHWSKQVTIGSIVLYFFLLVCFIVRNQWTWKAAFSTAVWALAMVGVFALHFLLDVNFPIRRTAMHLPFLMLVSAFTLLDGFPKLVRLTIGGSIASLMALNFAAQLNLNHIMDWRYECMPKEFVARVAQFQDSTGRKPIVSCNGFMNYFIGYQMPFVNGGFYAENFQKFPSEHADLLIATENMKWDGLVYFDTLSFHQPTGMTLMQRKSLTKWTVVREMELVNQVSPSLPALVRIDSIENLVGLPLAIEIDMDLTSNSYPVFWSVYAQVWRSETESIFSCSLDMSATHYDLRDLRKVNIKSEFITLPEGANHLRIFVVSNNNKPMTVSDVHVSILADKDSN